MTSPVDKKYLRERLVRERLRLLHDVAGQCDVWREGDLFRARIIVPL